MNQWPAQTVQAISYAESQQPAKPEVSAEQGPQTDEKKDETKKDETKKDETKKDETKKDEEEPFQAENYNAYGQVTVISQGHGPFRSPYTGSNSLLSESEFPTSETATLFLGARLWSGGEIYFNPEVSGGLGLSNVFGLAGFPNGDITRVGNPQPTPYVARAYVTQTIGFGGEQEKIESGPNQLAVQKDVNRLTFTLGKTAATDWFDVNKYSHDPRSQFMNWAIMYNGAWDYPADVRGYTWGGVVEWNTAKYALRYGLFAEPSEANGPEFDMNLHVAHGQAVELENRYKFLNRPGKIRSMFYWNRANMGNYGDALRLMPVDPDVTQTRTYQSVKYGFGINIEQEVTDNLGAFFRWGWSDGHTETWAFTEIDRTLAFGLLLKGAHWSRPQDEVGTAMNINGLAGVHSDYLGAGGLDFKIGDGRLDYGREIVWESYYRWQLMKKSIWLTPDFQLVGNPAYNRDRGPVAIGTIRIHAEF